MTLPYEKPLTISDNSLSTKYLKTLTASQREALIEPLFQMFRENGFNYEVDFSPIKDFQRIQAAKTPIINNSISPTVARELKLCKAYFPQIFATKFRKRKSLIEAFNRDDELKKAIRYILALDEKSKDKRISSASFKSLLRAFTSAAITLNISLFKPSVAKGIYERYSKPGETVYDYSAGWGGRMLGALAAGRKYIGIDPLTHNSLKKLAEDLGQITNTDIISGQSEEFSLGSNTVDFIFSSPPYYNLEVYCDDESQAYNKGEEYFYDTYWKRTLSNCFEMLRSGRNFGLHTNVERMISMATDQFGPVVEEIHIEVKTSQLHKTRGKVKHETIYIYYSNK